VAVPVDDGDEEDPEKIVALFSPASVFPLTNLCPSFPSSVSCFPPLHYSVRRGQLYSNNIAYGHRVSNEVQAVLVAMLKAVYMLSTLLFLLLFLTFIFTLAGIQLFGNLCTHSDLELEPRVALRCQLTDPSMIMPDQYNFKTIPTSILLLWRFILVDGWVL